MLSQVGAKGKASNAIGTGQYITFDAIPEEPEDHIAQAEASGKIPNIEEKTKIGV